MRISRSVGAGLCALILCCCLTQGTGEKIKLVGQCKCWALDGDTVSLRDCDEDGTDFSVPEGEGQIRPVGSPGNQCLIRKGTQLQLALCPSGSAIWTLSGRNQYSLQEDGRQSCLRATSQATRLTVLTCPRSGVSGPSWEVVDPPEGQSVCEEASSASEETPSSPPPPPPSPQPAGGSSNESSGSPPSGPGAVSATAIGSVTGGGSATAIAIASATDSGSDEGKGEKIKLVGQCKCWALDDNTVGLRDCDEDGTDFSVPEGEGQIRPVGSPGNQCLVRRGTQLQLALCPSGSAIWTLSGRNQYSLQEDGRQSCLRATSQATRLTVLTCPRSGVSGPSWEVVDPPEGQSVCEEASSASEETPSSPPPPPQSPQPAGGSSNESSGSPPSEPGAVSATVIGSVTGGGSATAIVIVNGTDNGSDEGD